MISTRLASLLFCSLVLLACSSKPNQDYDTGYDFSQLHTFSGITTASNSDPLSAQRSADAIQSSLLTQGFKQADDTAQFKVNYTFNITDKPKKSGLSIGLGTGNWGSSGGVGIGTSVGVPIGNDSAKLQTIQIDMIDIKTQQLIWRGSDNFSFDTGGEDKAQLTQQTVAKILAQFPPQESLK